MSLLKSPNPDDVSWSSYSLTSTREELRDRLREHSARSATPTPEAFVQLLQGSMDELDLDDSTLATALGVSRPTVNRWRNGEVAPHVATRRRCLRGAQSTTHESSEAR